MGNANPKVRFVVGRAGYVVTHDITLTNKRHKDLWQIKTLFHLMLQIQYNYVK